MYCTPGSSRHTHPDSFGILEKPNMSMWSCYRTLRPEAQVLRISILIHIQVPSHSKPRQSTFNRDPYQESTRAFRTQNSGISRSSADKIKWQQVSPLLNVRCADSPVPWLSTMLRSEVRRRGSPPTSLLSLWDESALAAPLHLASLICSEPAACALHLSARRSAAIPGRGKQGRRAAEEGRREREWKRDGIGREGGGEGQSERMTDALRLSSFTLCSRG